MVRSLIECWLGCSLGDLVLNVIWCGARAFSVFLKYSNIAVSVSVIFFL